MIKPDASGTIEEDATAPADAASTSSSSTSGESNLPTDIFSDVMPDTVELPLDGAVKTKDYAKLPLGSKMGGGNGTTSNATASTERVASTENAEVVDDGSIGATTSQSTSGEQPQGEQPPLSPEEKHQQATMTVEMFLRGYEKMHSLGRYISKMDMNELATLHASRTATWQSRIS